MKMCLPLAGLIGPGLAISILAQTSPSFINFETAPVHPVALSADAQHLAVCNLPDGRVEIFDLSTGVPIPRGSVPVGVDPVSVRFRTTNELWVVNHISASVNIVDLARMRVIATIDTLPGAADVVFAGSLQRAFVSCARDNVVQVFSPVTRTAITNLAVDGDRPKAMAVSPDGSKVYVAIFESGNASTILAPPLTPLDRAPEYSVVSDPAGPYGGQDPPPNNGTSFNPPLNPHLPEDAADYLPGGRLIVKKNSASRWMDGNSRDWTEFVSGTNSTLSGRPFGWDMPDRDLAIIDTTAFNVTYASGLMNLCMDVAVNPASGKIAVLGTDAMNERRFEPNLQSTFLHVNLALVDPATLGKTLVDLNPHLDYTVRSLPQTERDKSIGDPRGIVWNADGTRAYVTGMGSRNLVVVDANGNRVHPQPVELGEGPTGLALDESRSRLFVLNRFSATLSVLDTTTLALVTNVHLFDPTPAAIKTGRQHLYDTRKNSGLGHVACASCHPDARFDRLAWDLGNPAGEMMLTEGRTYHPMKGPMVTQTLQDMIGIRHWRGDRLGIEGFNITFSDLLGRDALLATHEMQDFKNFLATIHFPPNRFRNFDNSFPTNMPLPGHTGVSADGELDNSPLPNGNALAGRTIFRERRFRTGSNLFGPDTSDTTQRCDLCHNGDSGTGIEHDVLLLARNNSLPFKGAQLRSLADKLGMNMQGTSSRAGFGFLHDGRVDSLTRFLVQGLEFNDNQELANMVAFLLSFSGGGTMTGSDGDHSTKFAPAAVGRQLTITAPATNSLLDAMLSLVRTQFFAYDDGIYPVEVVVRGAQDGVARSWLYHPITGRFRADRNTDDITTSALLALAAPDNELTFTVVAAGTGERIGVDRDGDGYYDRTEIEHGLDPLDPLSRGSNTPPFFSQLTGVWTHPGRTASTNFSAMDADLPPQTLTFSLTDDAPAGTSIHPTDGTFSWIPSPTQTGGVYQVAVRVTDNGSPPLDRIEAVQLAIVPLHARLAFRHISGEVRLAWDAVPGARYRVQFKPRLEDATWNDLPGDVSTEGLGAFKSDTTTTAEQRFYRITLVE